MTRRLIIAGSRDLSCKLHCVIVAQAAERFVGQHWRPDFVISGACKGADTLGEHWADTMGIAVKRYPAEWSKLGSAAGPIRNQLMVDVSDGLVVVRGRKSCGSHDVLTRAQRKGIPIVDVVLTDLEMLKGHV